MDGKGGGAQYQLKIAITDGEKQVIYTILHHYHHHLHYPD